MNTTVKYTLGFMVADLVTTLLFRNPIEAKVALIALVLVLAYAIQKVYKDTKKNSETKVRK